MDIDKAKFIMELSRVGAYQILGQMGLGAWVPVLEARDAGMHIQLARGMAVIPMTRGEADKYRISGDYMGKTDPQGRSCEGTLMYVANVVGGQPTLDLLHLTFDKELTQFFHPREPDYRWKFSQQLMKVFIGDPSTASLPLA